jgi:hypothetical protein
MLAETASTAWFADRLHEATYAGGLAVGCASPNPSVLSGGSIAPTNGT